MIAALDRKLLRDLTTMRGQVITIALVVAAGIASYVTLQGTYASLLESRDAYYDRYRFGDVFALAKRAPLAVARRIEALHGVARAYPRIEERVMLPMPEEPEPASGAIVSIPESGERPPLNDLSIQRGRWPEPGRADEILLLDNFAKARGIVPGDALSVVLNGSERELRVVGTALSPEYVFAIEPGNAIPDPDAYAVIWMREDAIAASYRMEGAFNSIVLRLQPGASADVVLDAVDRILEPYGGFGAVGRDLQQSNYFLTQELGQLETMATIVPIIFLGVAAFLLNVVLSRLIHLQREQIAVLAALGYSGRQLAVHYLKLVSVVVVLGALLGIALGAWLGSRMMELYTPYFHFPVLRFRLDVEVALVGIAVSLVAAFLGAALTVRNVARIPPAEAMRPPAPPLYGRNVLERIGALALFGTSARMIVREITRRPLRLLLSSAGISMAVAILVAGRFGMDSFEFLIIRVFQTEMTEDLAVSFVDPMPTRVVGELAHLPGVSRAEGIRVVPVRFEHGSRHRDSVIYGYPSELTLRRLMDGEGRDVALPREGLLLDSTLARILGVGIGDTVRVRVREGQRGVYDVPVAGLIDEMYGLQGYMRMDALGALLREERAVSTVLLDVDAPATDEVRRRLRDMRGVLGITRRAALIERVRAQTGATWNAMTLVLTLFAATIAVGVVYNNARVALSQRSRDLASLRVLGFTRAEISAVLLGEIAVQILLAIPAGLVIGTGMAEAVMASSDPERYRMPVIISSATYAFATTVTLAAGLLSALLVRRRLDRLDLIGVLKTRE